MCVHGVVCVSRYARYQNLWSWWDTRGVGDCVDAVIDEHKLKGAWLANTVGHWDSRISAKKSIASQACD
jgi:hypothetical protein